jgi:hypothetical protein
MDGLDGSEACSGLFGLGLGGRCGGVCVWRHCMGEVERCMTKKSRGATRDALSRRLYT